MSLRTPALRLCLFYSAFFLAWGAVLPYWPVWHEARGLTAEQVGLAAALGLVARMLVSPLAALWSDGLRLARFPLVALAWLTLAFWLAHIPARDPSIMLALAFFTGAALYPIIPLSDSLAVREARRGGFAFGPVRAVGSAAFIVANLACGAAIGRWGAEAMLVWMIAASALLAGAAHLLPRGERMGNAETLRERLRSMSALVSRPDFLLALTASGFIIASHAFYYSFSALAWRQQGMDATVVGALWGVGVAAEIVFFAVTARFGARLHPALFLAAGGIAGALRWLLTAMSPPLAVLFGLQCLHALSFGAVFLGFVLFAERIAGERSAAGALALNSAISGGAFAALAAAASGWLFARYGAGGFAVMAVPAGIGALAALLLFAGLYPQSKGEGGAISAPR